jgi:hypothetical protein
MLAAVTMMDPIVSISLNKGIEDDLTYRVTFHPA